MFFYEINNYSLDVAWPSELILETIRKDKYIGYLDEYNNKTSEETSEENDFLNMTEEKIKALDSNELYRFSDKLYNLGFHIFIDLKTYCSVIIFSCAFSSFILYLILSLFISNENSRNRIDRD
jgi:hypothetical protein